MLGLSPGEDSFCNSETNHGRKTPTEQSCLYRRGDHNLEKENLAWVRDPMKWFI
jgi:hypothetical protein